MKKTIVLIIFTPLAAIFAFLPTVALQVGLFAYDIWHANTYRSVVQILPHNNGNNRFVLMTELNGVGDRAWYVYKIGRDEEVTDAMRDTTNKTGVLFWNYVEGGDQTSHPEIKIVDNRYLLFSRGGLHHSLYDLATRQVLINEESPWHAAPIHKGRSTGNPKLDHEVFDKKIRAWKVENLHNPILRLLEKSKSPS